MKNLIFIVLFLICACSPLHRAQIIADTLQQKGFFNAKTMPIGQPFAFFIITAQKDSLTIKADKLLFIDFAVKQQKKLKK